MIDFGQDISFTKVEKVGIVLRDEVIQEAANKHSLGFIFFLMQHAVKPNDDESTGSKESVDNAPNKEEWYDLITLGSKIQKSKLNTTCYK